MFKQLRQSNVAKAVRFALFSGVTLSMLPTYATAQEEQKVDEPERISVTGSRLQKAEFDQAAPVQVLEIDSAVKAGISTVAELLQRTSLAGGQQLDATYNSNSGNSNASEAPPTGGVGSSNVGLRGLGPERTLILVNGRRLGSSGVRGAPAQPDLSLLPLNMVDRIEIITEGASSIYGADAVAGVINVILKRGMNGTEVSANISETKDGGGSVRQFSFVTGHQGEKSTFVISGSYYDRERITVGSRADGCIRWMVHDDAGNIYDACRNRYFNNAVLNFGEAQNVGGDFFAFYTPGSTDIGVDNWSSGGGLPAPNYDYVTIEGSGRNNYTYNADYHDQWDRFNSDLIQPATRYTIAANGTVALDLFGGDEEFFYETYYFHRHLTNQASSEQQIPTIPGMIPQEDANGDLLRNDDGSLVLVDNPLNPFAGDAMPVVTIDELSQKRHVELDHIRVVAGLRGDFTSPTLNEKDWNYEMFASYDRGMGHQSQPVLHEEHLFISNETLRFDADGNLTCGLTGISADYGGILTLKECVPVNWFAPNIFSVGEKNGGSFGSDAERDYLIATRTNRTVVEQTMFSAYATGEIFEFDNGGASTMAFGVEYRKDDIWSAVDYLGATGGNAGENPLTEGATIGSRDVSSAFTEIYLPIIDGQPGIETLDIEAALRYTKESNFGNETTSRMRVTYKPINEVILSASYGTSFRAPNLREQFLADQFQGVSGTGDPCSVPGDASADGVYNPSGDTRSDTVINNCLLDGADPYSLGLNGILNIPVTVGGNATDLLPETTDNYTYSFKWNPDFGDTMRMNFAITFFEIEIENTIRSINGATIMSRCYNDAPNLASPFCERLQRNGEGKLPSLNFITEVDGSFLNVGLETSKGFDINLDFSMDFGEVFGEELTVTWTNIYTQMTEREVTIFEEPTAEELAGLTEEEKVAKMAGTGPENLLGDFGNNRHRLATNLTFDMGNFSWLLAGRYISGTQADDTTSQTWACDRYVQSTEIMVNGQRPMVQPICNAGGAFYLDTSVTWSLDDMRISAGITNLFDKRPPMVSMFAGSNRANMVTSSGYDLIGQSYFLNATYSF